MKINIAIGAIVLMGGMYPALHAQPTRTVWDGVYSEAQAARGAALYDKECGSCHGPGGNGGSMAPALVGPAFSANYDGQTLADLFGRNRNSMPPGKEGPLSLEVNADITAYMLQCNKFPSGEKDMPSQSMMLKQIQYLAEKPATP
jgi:mono/diheme cytochrome c family protein